MFKTSFEIGLGSASCGLGGWPAFCLAGWLGYLRGYIYGAHHSEAAAIGSVSGERSEWTYVRSIVHSMLASPSFDQRASFGDRRLFSLSCEEARKPLEPREGRRRTPINVRSPDFNNVYRVIKIDTKRGWLFGDRDLGRPRATIRISVHV